MSKKSHDEATLLVVNLKNKLRFILDIHYMGTFEVNLDKIQGIYDLYPKKIVLDTGIQS